MSLDIRRPRPIGILVVIMVIIIIDNGCLVIDIRYLCAGNAVAIPVPAHEVALGNKNPEIERQIDRHPYLYTRHQGSPSVISASGTPVDPSRAPCVVGNPGPSEIVVVKPAPVMERSPSPIVVRQPCIAVFSHYPPSAGIVRMEIRPCRRDPDRTVLRVVRPSAVRRKGIEKHGK